MAYTIISQNNTTTTLSDENGNVITVPARVTLATSTDYTIIKVNNNSVDLESGDGKIIRGVPACVVLAGEGGGGGGSVDYAKTVQRAETMPTADASNAGQQFLYSGESNATYTHGYVYENVKTATYTGTVSFETATLSGTTVTCSGADFANFLTEAGADPTPIVSGTMTFEADANGWRLVGKDSNDNTVTTFIEYVEDYEDAGFTFTGTPQDNDVIAFTCTVEEASATYTWTRIDVQPAPEALPDQTGQNGKFLTTNGTTASWGTVPSLPSQTGQSGKFLTTDGTDASWATINALQNTATGTNSLTILGTAATAQDTVNIGTGSSVGRNAVAVGKNSQSGAYGIAIGAAAKVLQTSLSYGVALGYSATVGASAGHAVQIGDGTNNDSNTFKVANANGNFEIMSADGTIPEARLADTTNAQQGDVLTLDSTGNAVWGTPAAGITTLSITLPAADWSGSAQTVTATGVTSASVVIVGAAPASTVEYNTCGVVCTAQGTDSLSFSCTSIPTNDLTVTVLILA